MSLDIRATTDADARKTLAHLVQHQPGLLKVLTQEHACLDRRGVPETADERLACRNYTLNHQRPMFVGTDRMDPLHRRAYPVVRIESHGLTCAAVAEDGSATTGRPLAVLRRLLEVAIARGDVTVNGLGQLMIPKPAPGDVVIAAPTARVAATRMGG